ncbi:uncharacterized protein A4U43_C07F23600, partial [Asparagus officinalis]
MKYSSFLYVALAFSLLSSSSSTTTLAFAPSNANNMTGDGVCQACGDAPCLGKPKWTEMVGVKASEAKKTILKENPYINEVLYIWCDWKRIMDCCCNRVWLFVDGEGKGSYEDGK